MEQALQDKIKLLIGQCSWSDLQKGMVLEELPNIGENFAVSIIGMLSSSTFELVKDEYFNAIMDAMEALQGWNSGDYNAFIELLKKSLADPDCDFGRYLIPFLQDIKILMRYNKLPVFEGVKDVISAFEFGVFEDLPEEELKDIVRNNLLYFVRHLNLQMEFKRLKYAKHLRDDETWAREYLILLQGNEELLGSQRLQIDNKSADPMLKNWLLDYTVSSTKPIAQRSAYDEIHYIQTSKNVARLSQVERDALMEVLKFYEWLYNPAVTEEEIENYRESDLQSAQVRTAPLTNGTAPVQSTRSNTGQPLRPSAPIQRPITSDGNIVSKPLNVGQIKQDMDMKRQQAQEIIDEKLDELKHKVQ